MKRILILSNACFSESDSNGRTLEKLFDCFDKNNLAQFYVYGAPDFNICNRFYQVSDGDAFKSFLKRCEMGKEICQPISTDKNKSTASPKKKLKKSPLNMLLREFAWKYGKWNGRKLQKMD